MSDIIHISDLTLPIFGLVLKDQYKYYTFTNLINNKLLTIHVLPNNNTSDPDIYINNSSSLPDKQNFIWRSALIGKDRVDILPNDSNYIVDNYTIGIYGYADITNFTILINYHEPVIQYPIDVVKKTYPLSIKSTELTTTSPPNLIYFTLVIPSNSISIIYVEPNRSDLIINLYASDSIVYPNSDLFKWKSECCDTLEHIHNNIPTIKLELDGDEVKYYNKIYISIEAIIIPPIDDEKETLMKLYKKTVEPEFTIYHSTNIEGFSLLDDEKKHYEYFNNYFKNIDGAIISQDARKSYIDELKLKDISKSFTYGEIDFVSFAAILNSVVTRKDENNLIFVDLGSGIGKALLAAEWLYPFKKLIGIELLPNLYNASTNLIERYSKSPTIWPSWRNEWVNQIEVIKDDFLIYNWWSNADIVFTSSICFDDNLYGSLSKLFLKLKKTSKILTLRTLPEENFQLLHREWYKMSWGKCLVYVYRPL